MAYCMEEAAKRKIAFYVFGPAESHGAAMLSKGRCWTRTRLPSRLTFRCRCATALTIGELAQFFKRRESHQLRFACNSDEELAPKLFFSRSNGRARWIPPLAKPAHIEGGGSYTQGLRFCRLPAFSVGARNGKSLRNNSAHPGSTGKKWPRPSTNGTWPGLRFYKSTILFPVTGLYSGQRCGGVAVRITDRQAVRAMRMGIEIATLLKKFYPDKFESSETHASCGQYGNYSRTAGWRSSRENCRRLERRSGRI